MGEAKKYGEGERGASDKSIVDESSLILRRRRRFLSELRAKSLTWPILVLKFPKERSCRCFFVRDECACEG